MLSSYFTTTQNSNFQKVSFNALEIRSRMDSCRANEQTYAKVGSRLHCYEVNI